MQTHTQHTHITRAVRYTPLEGSPDLIERGYVSTGLRMTVQGGGGVGSSNSPGSNNAAGRPNGRGYD